MSRAGDRRARATLQGRGSDTIFSDTIFIDMRAGCGPRAPVLAKRVIKHAISLYKRLSKRASPESVCGL